MNASLARRLAALSYEILIVTALILVVGFLTLPLVGRPGSAHKLEVPDLPARVLSFCTLFSAGALYFTWSWTKGRRTLPMKTWRMQLVRSDGRTVDAKTAIVRYLAAWIGPAAAIAAYAALKPMGAGVHALWFLALNFVWALVDSKRQFLHDRIAGTRIVIAPA